MKKILFFVFLTICFSLSSQIYSTGTETLLPGLTANIEINGNTFITKLTLAGPSDAVSYTHLTLPTNREV